jgi:hypothetical protein
MGGRSSVLYPRRAVVVKRNGGVVALFSAECVIFYNRSIEVS